LEKVFRIMLLLFSLTALIRSSERAWVDKEDPYSRRNKELSGSVFANFQKQIFNGFQHIRQKKNVLELIQKMNSSLLWDSRRFPMSKIAFTARSNPVADF